MKKLLLMFLVSSMPMVAMDGAELDEIVALGHWIKEAEAKLKQDGLRFADMIKDMIARGADINAPLEGQTPLYYAVQFGDRDLVRLLLRHGAPMDRYDENGNTPLHRAVLDGDCAVVHTIITQRTDSVNVRALDGTTPLHAAAWSGNQIVAQLLLDHGAQVALCSQDNNTALHNAAIQGHGAVVQLLLDHGADVNEPGFRGRTALGKAIVDNRPEVARLLIARGASRRIMNEEGLTCYALAEDLPDTPEYAAIRDVIFNTPEFLKIKGIESGE